MSLLAASLTSSTSRPLGLRMRADLVARRHRYQGRNYWVVKEPVGLKYYRFQEEEYAILRMLDGRVSLEDIRNRFHQEFAPQKITFRDLQQFIGMLHRSGLVVADSAEQGRQLLQRAKKKRWKERLAAVSNVLAIRFPGIDPQWLLDRLYPWTRWFFSPVTVLLCAMLGLAALSLVVLQFDLFRSRLPAFHEFFGPANWIWFALVLAAVKVVHELAHGLACKHFGGECHEIGVMLLVLTPCLYCNTSDSWLLASKWRRAAIGAAGIYVELLMASLATFVWWFSEPGLVNHMALRVMFICSVSTLLFNGNPLLRYDGYYILADLVEIPNLRQKASRVLQRIMGHWCLGIEPQPDPFLPQRGHWLFAAYTIASVCYRWVVVLSILWFLNHVFEPLGLKPVGQMIALVGLVGLVVMPLYQLGKFLYIPGRMDQVKKKNVAATAAVAAAALLAVALLPLPRYVYCPVQIEPRDAHSVYVDVPGYLDRTLAQPGQRVRSGAPLAELRNLDVQLALVDLRGQAEAYRAQLETLRRQRIGDASAAREIPHVLEALATVESQLREKEQQRQRLTLVAPAAGVVLPPPPRRPPPTDDDELTTWNDSPLEPFNLGARLEESDLLCRIGDPARLEAAIVIDQRDVELVREDQPVVIKLDAFPSKVFESRVERIARMEMRDAPAGLANQAGGELATRTDAAGRRRPLSTSYLARAPIDDPDGQLLLGLRGRARVFTGWQPLAGRAWRYLARTFHFDL